MDRMSAPKLKFQCYRQKARQCKPHVRERDNRWWEARDEPPSGQRHTCANHKGTDCFDRKLDPEHGIADDLFRAKF